MACWRYSPLPLNGGGVQHRWQTNVPDGWADWADLGGNLLPGLVAARNRDGRIELFGVGASSNDLVHCWQRNPANAG